MMLDLRTETRFNLRNFTRLRCINYKQIHQRAGTSKKKTKKMKMSLMGNIYKKTWIRSKQFSGRNFKQWMKTKSIFKHLKTRLIWHHQSWQSKQFSKQHPYQVLYIVRTQMLEVRSRIIQFNINIMVLIHLKTCDLPIKNYNKNQLTL
jgi:hypothetical protein